MEEGAYIFVVIVATFASLTQLTDSAAILKDGYDVDKVLGDTFRTSRYLGTSPQNEQWENIISHARDALWDTNDNNVEQIKDEDEKRAFSPWGGKRAFSPWGGKRAFSPWGGKRVFNPWGGKRAFNPWGGKRDMLAGEPQEHEITEPLDEEKRAFNPWGGKRAFNPWGGKRAFSPWGGKRDGDAESFKRGFNPWGGKRAFNPWGGKRSESDASLEADDKRAFSPWGGKRSDDQEKRAFNPWGGKRSALHESE